MKFVDKKYSNSERDAFSKGLNIILTPFKDKIDVSLITQDLEDFCVNHYQYKEKGYIKPFINDDNAIETRIANFIYDVRCSIVHNKDAEFHITSINYDLYSPIIPFMKEIIKVVGCKIMETLNSSENKITFEMPTIPLY